MSLVTSTITTFTPGEPKTVGFYTSGTEVATIVCDDEYEFRTSSTYGICCPTANLGDCYYRARCSKSLVIYEEGPTSITCPNNDPCVETTVYEMAPSHGRSATIAGCRDPDNPTSIYRTFVSPQVTSVPKNSAHTTASSESTLTSSDIPITITATATTDPTTNTSGDAGQTGTPVPAPDDDSGPKVGAIAGGVVGGVAGLVLILVALLFVWRRQKKKNAELREIGPGYQAPENK